MANLHPNSIIDKTAEIAKDVEIGPFCTVGPYAKIGSGTKLMSHVVVGASTTIGQRCLIFPNACLGLGPQDKKAKDKKGFLVIGDENVIREFVTMHAGSKEDSYTRVGHRNYFMNYSHVGHDCSLGNDIIVTNGVQLGGFVEIEDAAVLGGIMGVHQFVRIGRLAMVGGMSKVTVDVPPFSLCDGNPFRFRGTNIVGMRRAGFSAPHINAIKKALIILFASGRNRSGALADVKKEFKGNAEIAQLVAFIENSKRGLVRSATEKEAFAEEAPA